MYGFPWSPLDRWTSSFLINLLLSVSLSPPKVIHFIVQFSSVAQSFLTLRHHESQHARPPCPSPTLRVHSNSCPSSRWCHPAISSSVVPFSSCPQSLPASGSFPISQLFAWGGQSTGASALASVLGHIGFSNSLSRRPRSLHIESKLELDHSSDRIVSCSKSQKAQWLAWHYTAR